PAAAIAAAHTPRQRHVVCTLATLAGEILRQEIESPAILVIGDVVKGAQGLPGQWPEATALAEEEFATA
ncbi:MAG TPA: hypothetical protein VF319_00845, partial [Caldimonas sp.]